MTLTNTLRISTIAFVVFSGVVVHSFEVPPVHDEVQAVAEEGFETFKDHVRSMQRAEDGYMDVDVSRLSLGEGLVCYLSDPQDRASFEAGDDISELISPDKYSYFYPIWHGSDQVVGHLVVLKRQRDGQWVRGALATGAVGVQVGHVLARWNPSSGYHPFLVHMEPNKPDNQYFFSVPELGPRNLTALRTSDLDWPNLWFMMSSRRAQALSKRGQNPVRPLLGSKYTSLGDIGSTVASYRQDVQTAK